jgi:hypothetical protein
LEQSDGIHPGGTGYQTWANAIWSDLTCLATSAPAAGYSRRVLTGFSAGGAFLEGMCSDKATSDQLDAVLSLDSWYFGGSPPGLMKYVDRAVSGKALMILTTSGAADYGFVTPSEAIKPMLAKIEPEDIPQSEVDLIFAGAPMPAPETAQRKGKLIHFGWGKTLFHTDHAKLVGPWLLGKMVSPYFASMDGENPPGPGPVPPGGSSWLWWVLGGGAALAAGWYGGAYAKRRWYDRRTRS